MNSALMETADLYAEDGPSFILPALASSYLFLFIIQLGVGLMTEMKVRPYFLDFFFQGLSLLSLRF